MEFVFTRTPEEMGETEEGVRSCIALVAAGKARLPKKKPPASFWKTSGPRIANDSALEILREERDAR